MTAALVAGVAVGAPSLAGGSILVAQNATKPTLIDCFDCSKASGGTGWGRIAGKALKAKDGSCALKLFDATQGSRYRAQMAGPNRGLYLGPDVRAVAKTARPPADASAES